MHELSPLADLAPEDRALAAPEDEGEEVERRRPGVGEARDRPGEGRPHDLHVLKPVQDAGAELRRLDGYEDGCQTGPGRLAEVLLDARARLRRGHVARDHDHHVVRDIALPVVGEERGAVGRGENVLVPDHWLAVRVLPERRREHRLPEAVLGIVLGHRDLAKDHVLLARDLVRGKRRMQDGVGEEVDRDLELLAREVDVVDGPVEGRVGVDVAAIRLDRRGDLPACAPGRALEEHVLQEMGQPRAELARPRGCFRSSPRPAPRRGPRMGRA